MKDFSFLYWILLLVGLNTGILWSQGKGPDPAHPMTSSNYMIIEQQSNRDSLIAWQEKVLLHLPDDNVANRSTLFFKGYLLTGPRNLRVNMSKVLKVELLDEKGDVVTKQYHRIEEGMVLGNMEIPKRIPSGKYYLRAYTRWMQNYGQSSYATKPVYIGRSKNPSRPDQTSVVKANIHPEGGNLLNGQLNRLVVRIDQSGGVGDGIKGYIKDQHGKVVSSLTSYSMDLFYASFQPEQGHTYELELSDGSSYALPEAKDHGCLMQVNNLDPDMAMVRIIATAEYFGKQLKLIVEKDGMVYLERYINMNDLGKIEFELPKKGIHRGILRLKLIDDTGKELSNRPVWSDGERLEVKVTPLDQEGAPSGEMILEVEVLDPENNPVETEVALSVVKISGENRKLKEATKAFDEFDLFPSHGLLGSSKELDRTRKDRFVNDLKLLSSAAEITMERAAQLDEEDEIKYPFQNGLELIGYAYDMENSLLRNTPIQVMAFSETDVWVQDLETDSNGRLVLQDLQLKGKTVLVFRTTGDQSEQRMVKVIPAKSSADSRSKTREKAVAKKEEKRIYEPTDQMASDTTGLIELQEVVVRESKASEKSGSPSLYNINPNHTKYQDPDHPKSIPELLLNIPNIRVIGIGTLNPVAVNIRSENAGGGPILYVLDGLPLSQGQGRGGFGTQGRNPLVEMMNMVPPGDVERIEFLTGPEAAIFGSRSNGGVLLFYTRTGSELRNSERKEAQLVFQGYEPSLDFEDYKKSESRRTRESMNTLYWNPNIKTDANGKATVRLTIPKNNSESLVIKASTVTDEGLIGRYRAALEQGEHHKYE